jgi:Na+/melibiose symporter-like transporter
MRGTRIAIALIFFADGLLIGSWAARVPAVQAHADLSETQLGLALFAASLGALVAMPLAGWLAARVGSRRVTIVALLGAASALSVVSLSGGLVGVALALFGFGAGFGAINVSANAQGLALERLYARPILSSFHAAFSGGALAGAALGALAAAAGIGPEAHLASVSLGVAVAMFAAAPRLLSRAADDPGPTRTLVRPPRALLVVGAAAFFTLLAEGAAADWSAVYLSRSLGTAAGVAALAYTAFSLAMFASRLAGDRVNAGIGPVALVRAGALLAAGGLALALVSGTTIAALVGFGAMGAGLGVVVPVLFRAAGSMPDIAAGIGVAAVSTIGWFGFLAGPPTIGVAAGAVGLQSALWIVVVSTVALALLAPSVASARGPDERLRGRDSNPNFLVQSQASCR